MSHVYCLKSLCNGSQLEKTLGGKFSVLNARFRPAGGFVSTNRMKVKGKQLLEPVTEKVLKIKQMQFEETQR